MNVFSGEERVEGRRRDSKERESEEKTGRRVSNKIGDLSCIQTLPKEKPSTDDRVVCCNTRKQGDRVSTGSVPDASVSRSLSMAL